MAKTIDNTLKNSRMKRIFLFLIVALGTLSSQGQYSETQRKLFTGTLENLEKVEPLVDSLLSYPCNVVKLEGERSLGLNTVIVTQKRPLTYAIVISLSSDNASYSILQNMYKTASHYAESPTLRHKELATNLLYSIYSILTEQYKVINKKSGSDESLRQIVDLAHKCQKIYYTYCFRNIVNVYPFDIFVPFADNELVDLLRYNLNNPTRTEQEMSIAIQCRNDEMYYMNDTLRCGSLPDSRLCRDLKELKRKSITEIIPLDTLIEQHNREVMSSAVSLAIWVDYMKTVQDDYCKRVLQLLNRTPIRGLEYEIEMYGKKYEQYGVDWMHILARLGYKDYVNRYAESVDSLLKRDEKMSDQRLRFHKAVSLLSNIILLGQKDGISKFAPLLLSKEMFQGDWNTTAISFQTFLLLRSYIPELKRYGNTRFLNNCKKQYIGKYYNSPRFSKGILIVSKQTKMTDLNLINCVDIYNNGDETDYRYYPKNFFKLMYDWMEKNKGKYKLNSTNIYEP